MQVLLNDYSAATAAAVMGRLAKLSARYIGDRGFSIGIDDVMPAHLLQVGNHSPKNTWPMIETSIWTD